jgi:hypothetical protein
MNNEFVKDYKQLKELEEDFEFTADDGRVYYQIRNKYDSCIIFGKEFRTAMAYIAIREMNMELIKKAFDANHSLWIDIFGDAAESVEVLEVFGDNSIVCKVHTEHDYDIVVRVVSYVEWEPEGFDGWPAWKIEAW